jgi:DNA (cytosine-5)-methyltransferase 1
MSTATTKVPKVLDLFCGCGGMSTGFCQAGFDIVAATDIWEKATDTYQANHSGTRVVIGDVQIIQYDDLVNDGEKIDVIVGGPPCQGFSLAGKRDQKDPRNSLFIEFIRIVNQVRPKIVVMENVPGILTMKTEQGEKVKDIIVSKYTEIGYEVSIQVLNAADYGVPQARKRVFFLGREINSKMVPTFPEPTHVGNHVPVSTVLLPRDKVDSKTFLSQKALDGIARKIQASRAKGHGFGAQFMDLGKPSFTIPARYWKDGYDALVKYDDGAVRRMVPEELALVQSFPKDYVFKGSKKDRIMQIGNAVPCLLAQCIAQHLKETLF